METGHCRFNGSSIGIDRNYRSGQCRSESEDQAE